MGTLHLVPIHLGRQVNHLPRLGDRVAAVLDLHPRVVAPTFDPEGAFDKGRSQYLSTRFLLGLLEMPHEENDRLLGITGVDLFVPVLTYVFGQAQLEGPASVVSSYRLDNTRYGLPRDDERLFERLEKEALHELGHTFGLLHCEDPECVMRSSTYAEEIDLKPARYCRVCRARAGLKDRGHSR